MSTDSYVAGWQCRACRQPSCKCKEYREQGVEGFTGQNYPAGSEQALHDWVEDLDEDETKPWVILDNGTYMQQAGLSGEEDPKVVFRSVVGRSRQRPMNGYDNKDYYVGEEAQCLRGILMLQCPLEHGIIHNWADMEKIWKHTFDNELRMVMGDEIEAEEDVAGVLLTEVPINPKENRERTTEIMFETFELRRFYLALGAVLSLYSNGRTTGVVLNSGASVTHSVPIYAGYSMPHATEGINLGGYNLDDYLREILTESKIEMHTTYQRESARKIKEDLCYVSMAFEEGVDNFAGKEKVFELPDMSVVTVHNQLIRCPELMFKPWLHGKEMSDPSLCYDSALGYCAQVGA